jgi:type I restriction enzyme R subunit
MGENDKIVTRYMADRDFQGTAFPILARESFEDVQRKQLGLAGKAGPARDAT